jgi:hypothetical protein
MQAMIETFDHWRAAMARAFEAAPSLIFVASHRGRLIIAAGRFSTLGKAAVNDNELGLAEATGAFGTTP